MIAHGRHGLQDLQPSQVESLRQSGLFDAEWYSNRHPDVAVLRMEALEYYLWIGASLKHNPSPDFDGKAYLAANPDVAAAGLNPLFHYVCWGKGEGRPLPVPPTSDDSPANVSGKNLDIPLRQKMDGRRLLTLSRNRGHFWYDNHALQACLSEAHTIEPIPPQVRRLLVIAHDFKLLTGCTRSLSHYLNAMTALGGCELTSIELAPKAHASVAQHFVDTHDFVIVNSIAPFFSNDGLIDLVRQCVPGRAAIYLHETEWVFEDVKAAQPDRFAKFAAALAGFNVLCASRMQQEWLREKYNVENSIVVHEVTPLPRPIASGVPANEGERCAPLRILMAGTIQPRKGTTLFSQVADMAARAGLPWTFHWAGKQVKKDVYMSDRVEWLGNLDSETLFDQLARCDIFFLSSEDDPFPLCVLEALQARKRVVVYGRTGVSELFDRSNDASGIVFDQFTPEAAMVALRKAAFFRSDPVGFDKINKNLSLASFVSRLNGAIAEFCQKHPVVSVPVSANSTPSPKIAAIVHLYYHDLWPEIRSYLKNLDHVPHDLYITLCGDHPRKDLDDIIKDIRRTHEKAIIIECPNRGMDAGPFVEVINHIAVTGRSYDLLVKVHTKKSQLTSGAEVGDKWRIAMFEGLLATRPAVDQILALFREQSHIGMIGPKGRLIEHSSQDLLKMRSINLPKMKKLAARMRVRDTALRFFCGTMFWCRFRPVADAIAKAKLTIRDFEPGYLSDASYAHAMERMFACIIRDSGQVIHELSPTGETGAKGAVFVHIAAADAWPRLRHDLANLRDQEADISIAIQLAEDTARSAFVEEIGRFLPNARILLPDGKFENSDGPAFVDMLAAFSRSLGDICKWTLILRAGEGAGFEIPMLAAPLEFDRAISLMESGETIPAIMSHAKEAQPGDRFALLARPEALKSLVDDLAGSTGSGRSASDFVALAGDSAVQYDPEIPMPFSLLKDRHRGEDVYVVASGPSAGFIDLSFFDGKCVIGVNRVFDYIPCQYAVFKEYPGRDAEAALIARGVTPVVARGDCGELNQGNMLKNNLFFTGRSTHFFDHLENEHTKVDLSVIGSDDKLVVSYSTITSAMHLAAYMGARNVVLVGHDCGLIDGEATLPGYNQDLTHTPWKQHSQYENWLATIEAQSIAVKRRLNEVYDCNVMSLNPFVNFGLEGHVYTHAASWNLKSDILIFCENSNQVKIFDTLFKQNFMSKDIVPLIVMLDWTKNTVDWVTAAVKNASSNYEAVNLFDISAATLKNIHKRSTGASRDEFILTEIATNALRKIMSSRTSLLLLFNDVSIRGKAISAACSDLKLARLLAQDGFLSFQSKTDQLSRTDRNYFWGTSGPEYIAVWGEGTKEQILERSNGSATHAEVVGPLKSVTIPKQTTRKARSRTPRVLWADQPAIDQGKAKKDSWVGEFSRIATELSAFDTVLRFHPSTLPKTQTLLSNTLPRSITVANSHEIITREYLSNFDIVITYYSTIFIDCIASSKPCIFYTTDSMDIKMIYIDHPLLIYCDRLTDIVKSVRTAAALELDNFPTPPGFFYHICAEDGVENLGAFTRRVVDQHKLAGAHDGEL